MVEEENLKNVHIYPQKGMHSLKEATLTYTTSCHINIL